MKFSLAFDIYNKEKWIESVLDSWISNLSGKNEYEIIMVFDNLKDKSWELAEKCLAKYPHRYMALFANDKFEIFCNNLALENATGDYIIFIQDDNWIYDKNWDLLLQKVIETIENIGAIGFLAGLKLFPPMKYQRIEINRPHKGVHFSQFNLPLYELGIWQVDAINRPFCISTKILKEKGGLDKAFMPMDGDDLDLSIKILKDGRKNVYIPFDLVNITAKKKSLSIQVMSDNYKHAMGICRKRYSAYLKTRKNKQIKMLFSLEETEESLRLL